MNQPKPNNYAKYILLLATNNQITVLAESDHLPDLTQLAPKGDCVSFREFVELLPVVTNQEVFCVVKSGGECCTFFKLLLFLSNINRNRLLQQHRMGRC